MGIFRFTEVMYQRIHEKIEVIGVYQRAKFKPVKFKWQQKIYHIKQINLVSDLKDGGIEKRMYSVQIADQVYRLVFDRQEESWWLEEVWVDDGC